MTPFNPLSPEFGRDPYPIWVSIREKGPIAPAFMGSHVLAQYGSVLDALRDTRRLGTMPVWDVYSRRYRNRTRPAVPPEPPIWTSVKSWMLLNDPPRHTRLRGAAQAAFLPARVRERRMQIRTDVDSVLDRLGTEEFDGVTEVGEVIPRLTVARMLDFAPPAPEEYIPRLRALALAVEPFVTATQLESASAAAQYFDQLFRPLVKARRGEPRDDVISLFVGSPDRDARLDDDEAVANATFMAFAGQETASSVISSSFFFLARQPELLPTIRDRPEAASVVAEELIRLVAPIQISFRRVLESHERHGVALHQGADLILGLGGACRDPAVFPDPDIVRLDRPKTAPIASFGGGAHYCIGAPLARIEIEEFLLGLAARAQATQVHTESIPWRNTLTTRAPATLRARIVGHNSKGE